jgi:hypothetical protein
MALRRSHFTTVASMFFLTLRVLHMLGAAMIVGGLVYLRIVVAPQAAGGSSDSLFGSRRGKWAMALRCFCWSAAW